MLLENTLSETGAEKQTIIVKVLKENLEYIVQCLYNTIQESHFLCHDFIIVK